MVHEKRVVRRIFGPKRGDITDDCRLHNEKLQKMFFTKCYRCNQLKEDKEIEHVMLMEEKANKYKILFWKPRGKVSLWRAMCR
jgi:hypothetical protein